MWGSKLLLILIGGKEEIKWFLKKDIFMAITTISQPHYIWLYIKVSINFASFGSSPALWVLLLLITLLLSATASILPAHVQGRHLCCTHMITCWYGTLEEHFRCMPWAICHRRSQMMLWCSSRKLWCQTPLTKDLRLMEQTSNCMG